MSLRTQAQGVLICILRIGFILYKEIFIGGEKCFNYCWATLGKWVPAQSFET